MGCGVTNGAEVDNTLTNLDLKSNSKCTPSYRNEQIDMDKTNSCSIENFNNHFAIQYPNNHLLLSSETKINIVCNVCCNKVKILYSCSQCSYGICVKCVGEKEKYKKVCPEGHIMTWYKNIPTHQAKCSSCYKKCSSGFFCKKDNYLICSNNCVKIKGINLCPNKHSLESHKVTHWRRCELCGRRDNQIFDSHACQFTVCHFCKEVKHNNQRKIPNKSTKTQLNLVAKKKKTYASYKRGVNKSQIGTVGGSMRKVSVASQANLREMSGVVSVLLKQNANMQASLFSIINKMPKELFIKRRLNKSLEFKRDLKHISLQRCLN